MRFKYTSSTPEAKKAEGLGVEGQNVFLEEASRSNRHGVNSESG